MKSYRFNNRVEVIDYLPLNLVDEEWIQEEPMLYSADPEFAWDNGGHLTRVILSSLKEQVSLEPYTLDGVTYNPIIDSKVVMLMPGMIPCIGGWHCDAVPRGEHGQPDMNQLHNHSEHYIAVIDTSNAPTEALGLPDFVLPSVMVDHFHVWKSVNAAADLVQRAPQVLPNASIVKFGASCLHRGTPAQKGGWRFFFRLSFMPSTARNKLRTQVNVYTDTSAGW